MYLPPNARGDKRCLMPLRSGIWGSDCKGVRQKVGRGRKSSPWVLDDGTSICIGLQFG
jgi:hypothetical protein